MTIFVNACKQGNICVVKYIYLKKNIQHDKFIKALRYSCYHNHLEIANWLYNLPERLKPSLGEPRMVLPEKCCPSLDLYDPTVWQSNNKYVFESCCDKDHLEMIIWLYNLSGFFDICINYYWSFEKSCFNGHLEVAQWLYNSLNSIDVRVENDGIFKSSCQNNHLKIASWLTTICDKYQLTISNNKIISHDP